MTYANGESFEKIKKNGFEYRDLKNLLRLLIEFSDEISIYFNKELDSITMRMIELDIILKKEDAKAESLRKAEILVNQDFKDFNGRDAFFKEWAFKEANDSYNKGNYKDVLKKMEALLRREPENISALMTAGRACRQLGDLVMAGEYFRRILERDGSFVEARIERAAIFRRQGKLERAETELEKARVSAPEKDEVHFELALLHGNSGEYTKAVIDYKRVLELDPFNPRALAGLGVIYKLKKEWNKSSMYFRKALGSAPQQVWPYIEYADMLERSGKYEDALFQIENALKIDPDNIKALRLSSRYYSLKGEFRRALEANLRILKIEPQNIYALYAVGSNYLKCRDYDSAYDTFRMILSLNSKEAAAGIGMGDALRLKGNHTEAMSYYDRVLLEDPESLPALNGKAICLLWLKRPGRGSEFFEKVLNKKPNDFTAAFGLAQASVMIGAWHKAVHYYELSKVLNPGLWFIYYEMANMYAWLGHYKKAKKNLEAIFKFDSQNQQARELYDVIDSADDPGAELEFFHLTQKQNSSETVLGTSFTGFLNDSFSYSSGLYRKDYYLENAEAQVDLIEMGLTYNLGLYTKIDLKSDYEKFSRARENLSAFSASMDYTRGRFNMNFGFYSGTLKEDLWQALAGIEVQEINFEIAYRLNRSFSLSLESARRGYEAPVSDWTQGFYSSQINDSNHFNMTLRFRPEKMENTIFFYTLGNSGFDNELDSGSKMFYYFTPRDQRLSELGVNYEKSYDKTRLGCGYSFTREDIDFLGTEFSVSSSMVNLFFNRQISSRINLHSQYEYKKSRDNDPENLFASSLQINF
jgi:tetratricopeptide (TPR) repeat protein